MVSPGQDFFLQRKSCRRPRLARHFLSSLNINYDIREPLFVFSQETYSLRIQSAETTLLKN